MPDLAEIIDLLSTARETLLAEVLPHVPPDRRYPALMAANGLAIALRGLQAGPAPVVDEVALCGAIRSGALDPGTPGHADAAATLVGTARALCLVSNPKAVTLSSR